MSLQWTLVAGFLYVEIVFIILLLLPIISARTWQKFFKSRFLKSLESQSNLYFSGFLVILVLLFLDSIREMRKYTWTRDHEAEHGHLSTELQNSMKLFRAQRNFYIAGFALFLCLVIRRLVLLITTLAHTQAQREAAMKQAESATKAAESLLDQQESSKKSAERKSSTTAASTSGDEHENDNKENIKQEKNENEMRKLTQELAITKEELMRCRLNCDAMKKQAGSLTNEYDRLMKEHEQLQKQIASSENKKDD